VPFTPWLASAMRITLTSGVVEERLRGEIAMDRMNVPTEDAADTEG